MEWDLARNQKPGFTQQQKDTLTRLLSGRRAAEGPVAEKGPITLDKVLAMVSFLRTRNVPEDDIFARRFCYFTGLRTCQMGTVARSNVECSCGKMYLTIERIHNRKATGREVRSVEMDPAIAAEVCDRWVRPGYSAVPASALLFPNWSEARMNGYIQLAAKELKWDPGLKWAGVHNLRHGLAVDLGPEKAAVKLMHGSLTKKVGTSATARYVKADRDRKRRPVAAAAAARRAGKRSNPRKVARAGKAVGKK